MAIIKWNPYPTGWAPFQDLVTIQDRINNLFEDSMGYRDDRSLASTTWKPLVDIFEDEEAITIKAELPEVDEKDVQINLDNNMLTIKGERKLEKEEKKESYHRVERYYGQFQRSFELPTTVDRKNIAASYDKGVLKIVLPKKEESQPKKVKIEIK
ncbi:MAG: Hsp20/alpha crystallin family protein [Deltaproteobacteria bacterium]|nr:Hsp20/alpha crystallin family protein [Deltaproteobacteria bacterium]